VTDYKIDDVIYCLFNTLDTDDVPTSAIGLTFSVYPNNSATEITAGIDSSSFHDSVTGLVSTELTLSSANGYELGKDYTLCVSGGTVDGLSWAGRVVGRFSIGRKPNISPAAVSDRRTLFPDRGGFDSSNIVEVGLDTAATFAVEFPLNEPGDLDALTSITITGAGTPTAEDLATSADNTRGHFTLPALTPAGDYVVVATATTVDGQTLKRRGTIRVS
jgi:hypothetical protein